MKRKFIALVIEGDQDKMYNIKNAISNPEIEIVNVKTGEEALMKIYNENIDFVLFDSDIRDMDSLLVLETILTYERSFDIPVVVITEKVRSDEFILSSYNLGIVDYIRKPINYEILGSKIEILIKQIKNGRSFERKQSQYKKKIEGLEKEIINLSKEKYNIEIDVNIDALTNIPNRRMFDKVLEKEWFRMMRSKQYLTVFMIDIDYFKQYNDKYGHVQGDECLIKVANIIDESFNRVGDFAARYGGDEFVAIVPNFEYEDAKLMANKLRENIVNAEIINEDSKALEYLTISIGMASIIPGSKHLKTFLVEEADSALYLAKKSGRNIVKGIRI